MESRKKIEEALLVIKNAYNAFKNAYKQGVTSTELLNVFLGEIKKSLPNSEVEYDFLVGEETKLIGGVTENYVPKNGDPILIDISVKNGGVWCDVCRTYFVGEITRTQLEVYEMIKRSIKAGESVLKTGAKVNELYNAVNAEYEKCGYTLVHHSGHQIETAPVEKPLFVASGNEILKDGFYTIESGLYKDFGMRLENDYFVDKNGATNLFENLMPLEAKEYILK
ncbi:MAG: aminopeptidase P family protein [Clostridia bacterium]|nr:aminopeptidase P family protein [Clostridia bacterium]